MSKIEQQITNLLRKEGIKDDISFTPPPKAEMGDLAFACFGLAKKENKNPVEVAKQLAEKINNKIVSVNIIEKVVSFGPYVNFYFVTGDYASLILGEIFKKGKKYGNNKKGKNKKC